MEKALKTISTVAVSVLLFASGSIYAAGEGIKDIGSTKEGMEKMNRLAMSNMEMIKDNPELFEAIKATQIFKNQVEIRQGLVVLLEQQKKTNDLLEKLLANAKS